MKKFKNVAVFGSTSAICHEFLKHLIKSQSEPVNLLLIAKNTEKQAAISDDLISRGAEVIDQISYDFCEHEQHQKTFERIQNKMPTVDLFFIAHGTLPDQKETEESVVATIKSIDENLTSTLSILNLAGQQLEQQQGGAIAAISSVAGDRGRKSNYTYGATKSALSAYLEGMSSRFSNTGVTITTIKPGLIESPMTESFSKGALWSSPAAIAPTIYRAIVEEKRQVYVPGYWALVMLIIRTMPARILERLPI